MHLTSLTLESFRSYDQLDLAFDPSERVTILTGGNATGKTNVIEAITVLSLLHSPRTHDEQDLIRWEREYYRIRGAVLDDEGIQTQLEVVSQMLPRKQRACFINGVKTPPSRYIGSLPLIVFTPDDLTLWSGSPAHRRRVLDILLCQISQGSLQALQEYRKILAQRNSLLRQIRDGEQSPDALAIWNEKLATVGAIVTGDRLRFFETIQQSLLRELHAAGERVKTATFQYVRYGTSEEETGIRDDLLRHLLEHQERDCARGGTTVGPHRDDWMLLIDGRDIATFASRGQQRAALLAFLLLQSSYIETHTGKKPLLLFDDVFSELDTIHRKALLQRLKENQVIISTVEMDEKMVQEARVLECPLQK